MFTLKFVELATLFKSKDVGILEVEYDLFGEAIRTQCLKGGAGDLDKTLLYRF